MAKAASSHAAVHSGFPRIGDYAFLSDCHTGALISPQGAVEWLCLPHFDSPSVFTALLDRDAGTFRLGPEGVHVPVDRRYVPGTYVLETTWVTQTGWIVVRDLLTVGPWRDDPNDRHDRPPTDFDAEHLLLRIVECTQGKVDLQMVCDLSFEYGSVPAEWEIGEDGTIAHPKGEPPIRFLGDLRLGLEGNKLFARHRLSEGESCFCGLSWSHDLAGPDSVEDAEERLKVTMDFWRDWLAKGDFPDHPWRVHLQRSALVLKGLTFAPTGAVVAAATTSLPETPGGERNWDYRFSWIRDSTFALWALHALGLDSEAHEFMEFIAEVCRSEGPEMQIMYGIRGEKELTERTLDHLSGYEGARPVRIGNAAYDQRQNDVFGALLDSVYIHIKTQDEIPKNAWEWIKDQVEGAASVWRNPDQGIWEARGEPKHYVSSKLMCWVALDRGARLCAWSGDDELRRRWSAIADEIKAEILDRGVTDEGIFRQHYETDALDASILLAPLVRFLPADDERVRSTVLAIADELTVNGLVLRYKVEETDDGLTGEEGTFSICSFWLASALAEIGEWERARALCERLLNYGGRLHLYAEELDPHSGCQLGNFPQAFTHLALINAVSHVIAYDLAPPDPEEEAGMGVFGEMRAMRRK